MVKVERIEINGDVMSFVSIFILAAVDEKFSK